MRLLRPYLVPMVRVMRKKGEELRGMSKESWLWGKMSGKCSWMAT